MLCHKIVGVITITVARCYYHQNDKNKVRVWEEVSIDPQGPTPHCMDARRAFLLSCQCPAGGCLEQVSSRVILFARGRQPPFLLLQQL